MTTKPDYVSAEEFDKIFQSVCNWGRWATDDEKGTLNYITPKSVQKAASLVKSGRTVSLAIPINKVAGPDNPHPALHYITHNHDIDIPQGEPHFVLDFLASECHGDCHSHMDALCHVSYRGRLYNNRPAGIVTSRGTEICDITVYAHSIVGRGVFLDIPRLRNVKWLEPGEAVTAEELEKAEKAQGVRLGEGDIFLFRTGHHRRRLELGPWDNSYEGEGKAGLHVDAMPWLHERKAAVFLPDGDGETVPCNVEGMAYPVHTLQITAMGMICADSLQFEELVKVCEEEKRWEFMVVVSPLRLPGGTGSLINPVAIF
ncbi:MAG: cyclase family protein [Spirochaetes bacterium]|nr:cyclase family protein [Spirochaetota bacterium]